MQLDPKQKQRARELRCKATEREKELWRYLRDRRLQGYKFSRQYPIGPYIVDFVCRHKKLVVEADGSQHSVQKNYDERRTRFLEKMGYKVLRFENSDIFQHLAKTLRTILIALESRFLWHVYPLIPDPQEGRRGPIFPLPLGERDQG
jgi:very-short-patch-repair endonuclease